MIKYILKRIVQVIPVLLGVSIIVFLMLSLSPGDPARLALGMNAKPEQIEAFNHENGMDQPVLVQYVNYMKGLVTGNLGVSYTTKQSVTKMIAVRLPRHMYSGLRLAGSDVSDRHSARNFACGQAEYVL